MMNTLPLTNQPSISIEYEPPSLKEQALEILDDCSVRLPGAHENILRRALEQLND